MCIRDRERAYRLLIEQYRVLESQPEAEKRETRMLDLDNAFHRRAFELDVYKRQSSGRS